MTKNPNQPLTLQVEPEELDELSTNAGWDANYYQLQTGVLKGTFSEVDANGLMVTAEGYNRSVQFIGASPRNRIAFVLPISLKSYCRFCGVDVDPSKLLIIPPSTDIDYHALESSQHVSIVVDSLLFENAILRLCGGEHKPTITNPTIATLLHAQEFHECISTLPNIDQGVRTPPTDAKLEDYKNQLLLLLARNFIGHSSNLLQAPSRPKSSRIPAAKRATDFIISELHSPLSVPEICAAADSSLRTLEYAFQELYGMTIVKYIKAQRLNQARRLLKQASSSINTVGNIAERCGIHHHGRFSSEYRQMFGELPSETLN